MVRVSNILTELLNEINYELTNQISLGKNAKIDARKLFRQSDSLNKILLTSVITQENKSMLQEFSKTLQDSSTVKSLRYERQDLERVLANLNDV
ncbi:hypothetical protein Nisw_01445 [Candidatus Nitrosopumilus sp. SW]|uniref:hypothetical protein n=1 Tax=Candidatus Nitrosopumilus sp. SW TaxID=2508726 RepID=UPI001153453E|nr:hypothetical protein [Candidatus Nitrosopumilus sp. SW]QDI88288.1 hypothetical protein Nisw_01445 [Candidatus Nitrosopumilus sp. SW]